MSKKIIRFRGLTLNKDEQAVEPGELALCGNVEMYDGALRPSVLKGTSLAGGANLNGTMIYIHKTTNYTNFITRRVDNGFWSMYWYAENGNHTAWTGNEITIPSGSPFSIGDYIDINHVGNTLCVLTNAGLFYFLFKNGSYLYLGQQPKFLELQFNLNLDTNDTRNDEDESIQVSNSWIDADAEDTDPANGVWAITESERSAVTEEVLAAVNRRIDALTADGYFYAPFFVRYAYRMFDGTSLIMHSPPVLMFSMLNHPIMSLLVRFELGGDSDSRRNKFRLYVQQCKLQMQCMNTAILSDLDNWSDVIKSVDIFITPQTSRIDTSQIMKTVTQDLYKQPNPCLYDGDYYEDPELQYMSVYGQGIQGHHVCFDFPEYDLSTHMDHVKNSASAFYKLASFTSAELRQLFTVNGSLTDQVFKDIEFDGSVLSNITVQQQMTDDYKTHNLLKPINSDAGLYVYNHRLNVHGIGEILFQGFSPWVMFPFMGQTGSASTEEISSVKVWITTESGVKVVEKSVSSNPCPVNVFMLDDAWVFYPDDRAFRMRLYYYNDTMSKVRKMDPAPFLNGAFSMSSEPASVDPTASTDRFVPMPNKIYTSKSDNPFYFPNLPGESGINTVGTGTIKGIAAVTRALSQGQVGDHDLVVFASDGIWVGKVSATGTYSNMHNISREVCYNKDSICQLDQSIVFATDRALNQFYESDVNNISEVLDGPIRSFATLLAGIIASDSIAGRLINFGTPAITLFKEGRVLYDYTSSRLIIFPSSTSLSSVCLVYSIRDKAWSTMAIPGIRAVLAGYPCPYVQYYASDDNIPTTDNQHGPVQCLDTPYTYNAQSDVVSGIIMSRTLTFSDTMDVIRGFRQLNDCATMPTIYFFGSNNQREWQQIGYSARGFHNYMPGHPFRFFRFAIYMQMHTDEKYQEVLLEIINKYAKL